MNRRKRISNFETHVWADTLNNLALTIALFPAEKVLNNLKVKSGRTNEVFTTVAIGAASVIITTPLTVPLLLMAHFLNKRFVG